TPMMVGLIGSSMTAGQLIMRRGRYKTLGIVGVSLTTLGMLLLSRMDVATTYRSVVANMMIVGVGLGLTMPVFNLAVQNAVDPRQVGAATASMQFLRSIGGSLGAAIFGAVLASRFSGALAERMRAIDTSGLPSGLLTSLANPQVLMNPKVTAQLNAMEP